MTRIQLTAVGFTLLFASIAVAQTQQINGLTAEIYVNSIQGPAGLAFAPDGTLFAGRDLTFGGGGNGEDPTRIYKIAPGGASFVEYGATTIADPDTLFYDATGVYSGTAGSVLVAGGTSVTGKGFINAILPDETVINLAEIDVNIDGARNINGLGTLSDGTLVAGTLVGRYFTFDEVNGTLDFFFDGPAFTGGVSVGSNSFGVGREDNIYASTAEVPSQNSQTLIWEYDGSTVSTFFNGLNASQTGNTPGVPIIFGDGSAFWGDDMYTFDRITGDFLRIDENGNATSIGSGWGVLDSNDFPASLAFGPDGFLYASLISSGQIIRFVPEPTSLVSLGLLALAIRRR